MNFRSLILKFCLIPVLLFSQDIKFTERFGEFKEANDFTVSSLGRIYIADSGTNELIICDTEGNEIKRIGGYGWGSEAFTEISDISVSGLNVLVTDRYNKSVKFFDRDLNFISEIRKGSVTNQRFILNDPVAASMNSKGDLYILDRGEKHFLKLSAITSEPTVFADLSAGNYSLNNPVSFEIDKNNNIYCLDGNQIKIYDEFGNGLAKLPLASDLYRINASLQGITLTNDSEILFILFDKGSIQSSSFSIPESSDAAVTSSVYNNKLFVLKKRAIEIFNFR